MLSGKGQSKLKFSGNGNKCKPLVRGPAIVGAVGRRIAVLLLLLVFGDAAIVPLVVGEIVVVTPVPPQPVPGVRLRLG
jgi:hypothetical protein